MITQLPKWVWHVKFECVVEVMSVGTYPDTVKVKMPNDSILEAYINDLRFNK